MTKQSKGFSAIELVIVLVVVLAAGLGGWYVWHKNQKKEPIKQSASNSQMDGKTNKQKQVMSDPSEGGKYLVIKEWGVRFPVPDELRGDIEYGIHNKVSETVDSESTEPHYISVTYLTSSKLSAKSGSSNSCKIHEDPDNPGNYEGGRVSILKSSTRIQPYQNGDVLIDGYWYQVRKGNGGVCYPGSDGQEEGAFIQSMIEALQSLKATPKS